MKKVLISLLTLICTQSSNAQNVGIGTSNPNVGRYLALLAETKARLTHREPFLTLDGLRMSKYCMFFSSAKAQRDLGYEARPYREALADALDWFRLNGYLQ